MSVSKWKWTEECDSKPCCGDCDECSEEDEEQNMTYREKFKEVFGADPIQDGWGGYCPPPKMHKCDRLTRECRQCMKWWDMPYEAPKGANNA